VSRLPVVSSRQPRGVLTRLGFVVARQRGSHAFYRHRDGRTTTVPNHAGRDIARPLLREILREISLSPDELVERLGQ
jgi:predicted RNA binding protein YcfA (HicA-like mRNA interferase family)